MSSPESWIDEVASENLCAVNAGIAQWVRMTGTEDERKAFDFRSRNAQRLRTGHDAALAHVPGQQSGFRGAFR